MKNDVPSRLQKITDFYSWRRQQSRGVVLDMGSFRTTVGQSAATLAGVLTAVYTGVTDPFGISALAVAGLAIGSYFFPVPERYGKFRMRTEEELLAMTRTQLRAYVQDLHSLGLNTADTATLAADALATVRGQAVAARRILALPTAPAAAAAAQLSLADLMTWEEAHHSHMAALKRWSQYELDPTMLVTYPAMTDLNQEPTSRMIKAMRQAKDSRAGNDIRHYAGSVRHLEEALIAAEANARTQQLSGSPEAQNQAIPPLTYEAKD